MSLKKDKHVCFTPILDMVGPTYWGQNNLFTDVQMEEWNSLGGAGQQNWTNHQRMRFWNERILRKTLRISHRQYQSISTGPVTTATQKVWLQPVLQSVKLSGCVYSYSKARIGLSKM